MIRGRCLPMLLGPTVAPPRCCSYRYVPRPIDTSAVAVDLSKESELGAAVNKLAKNSHEVWAAERVDQGWTFGAVRDDARRLHPLLVPWSRLDTEAKQCVVAPLVPLPLVPVAAHTWRCRVRACRAVACRYDLQSATQAVKVALALGYHVRGYHTCRGMASRLLLTLHPPCPHPASFASRAPADRANWRRTSRC